MNLDSAEAYGLHFRILPNDKGVGACLREYGEFARPEIDLIKTLCHHALVDVGANIGAISLPFAKSKPNCRVISIEAIPKVSQILKENVDKNNLPNVEIIYAAAGDGKGTLRIVQPNLDNYDNVGAISLPDISSDGSDIEIDVVDIDSVAPADVDFIKIDVEGYEPRVLKGASKLLKDTRPSWLIEVSQKRHDEARQVMETLRANGYNLYWFFSPFLTRRRPRRLDERPALRGDIAILATDSAAPWEMNRVEDQWPTDVADFPYLRDYGLISARP